MPYCKMRYIHFYLILLFAISNTAYTQVTKEVTHTEFQACNSNGIGTYSPNTSDKVTLEGIILNNPEEMLNSQPGAPTPRGGQWQIFVQPEDQADHAGTCVWMGQSYSGVGGSGDYSEQQYMAEHYRVDHDPNTGHAFRAGDKVKVTGWFKFYRGKMNINEAHQVESLFDIDIELLESRVGLPTPEFVTLDELKDVNDNFIFDQTRNSGCEYYQGRLIRINNVSVMNPQNWGPNKTITITDSEGRTFPIILGHGYGILEEQCPTGNVDIIGIMDQETASFTVCKDGYRIYLCNYDGNGKVLTDFGKFKNHIDGDIDMDGDVDIADFGRMAENWLSGL